jgi:hypothetical protein
VGDGDDSDPPRHQLEITHTIKPVPRRKMNTSEKDTQGLGELEENIAEMEVDNAHEVPSRAVMQIVESKLIPEELARDETTIFEQESMTLHHDKYAKEVG